MTMLCNSLLPGQGSSAGPAHRTACSTSSNALGEFYLAECLVAGLSEDVHHRLEGEPLWDLLATAQPAAELRAGKLGDLLALLLGLALLDVALLRTDIDHVLVVRHRHTQLRGVLLARLLRIVRTVEVVARDRALGPGHVTPNDEVRGTKVLPDDHVLNGLAWSGHLHAVRQVGPPEHGVLLLR